MARGRPLEDVLGGVFDPGPPPNTGPALVRYAGGREKLVQELTGLPRRPRRGDYTSQADFEAERRRWTSAQRRVQRWAAPEGKQRRGLTKLAPLPPAVRRRLRRDARRRNVEAAFERGVRVRILAVITIGSPSARISDTRERWLPALGTPGVYLDAGMVRDIWEDGDVYDRAAEFQAAFLSEYGIDEAVDVEEFNVITIKVWPEGTPEPA